MPEKARPQAGAGGSAGRVIAGVARGRRLVAPGAGTRPLGDRVKQSLFAIIEPEVKDGAFLDLFAGSGAAGIEALSRGARSAVFVERNRQAGQAIERNLRTTGLLGPRARIVATDALGWLAGRGLRSEAGPGAKAAVDAQPNKGRPGAGAAGDGAGDGPIDGVRQGPDVERGPFDAIVLDPPYDEPTLLDRCLEAIAAAGPGATLTAGGVAVAKHFQRTGPAARYGLLRSAREARFGETTLTFYRWSEVEEVG